MGRITLAPTNLVIIGSVAILSILVVGWGADWAESSGIGWLANAGHSVKYVVNGSRS